MSSPELGSGASTVRLASRVARREHASLPRASERTFLALAPQDVDLLNAIRQLTLQQRAAVALYYFEDQPLPEVAHILDCSHAAAKVHVFNARKRLACCSERRSSMSLDARLEGLQRRCRRSRPSELRLPDARRTRTPTLLVGASPSLSRSPPHSRSSRPPLPFSTFHRDQRTNLQRHRRCSAPPPADPRRRMHPRSATRRSRRSSEAGRASTSARISSQAYARRRRAFTPRALGELHMVKGLLIASPAIRSYATGRADPADAVFEPNGNVLNYQGSTVADECRVTRWSATTPWSTTPSPDIPTSRLTTRSMVKP